MAPSSKGRTRDFQSLNGGFNFPRGHQSHYVGDNMNTKNHVGEKYGDFLLIKKTANKKSGKFTYIGRCVVCGLEREATVSSFKWLNSTHENHRDSSKWFSNGRIRKIFNGMKARCYNPSVKGFRFYGYKGIHICSKWLDNPKSFEEWALTHGYKDNLTIDRIDSSKDYEPSNCRWVEKIENDKFKGNTYCMEINGEVDSAWSWSKRIGMNHSYLGKLIARIGFETAQEEARKMFNDSSYRDSKKRVIKHVDHKALEEKRKKVDEAIDKSVKCLGVNREDIIRSRAFNRRVKRPDSYEQFCNEMEELNWNYCAMGRKYGVSDNAIRKWQKSFEKFGF